VSHQLRTLEEISIELDIAKSWLQQQIDNGEIVALPIPARDGTPRVRLHLDVTADRIAQLAARVDSFDRSSDREASCV